VDLKFTTALFSAVNFHFIFYDHALDWIGVEFNAPLEYDHATARISAQNLTQTITLATAVQMVKINKITKQITHRRSG